MKKLFFHDQDRFVYGFLWVLIMFLSLEIKFILGFLIVDASADFSWLRNEEMVLKRL